MQEEPKQYVVERIQRALAEDPRVSALDLDVALAGGRVFLSGTVPTAERKAAISEVVRELLPTHDIVNETTVAQLDRQREPEELT